MWGQAAGPTHGPLSAFQGVNGIPWSLGIVCHKILGLPGLLYCPGIETHRKKGKAALQPCSHTLCRLLWECLGSEGCVRVQRVCGTLGKGSSVSAPALLWPPLFSELALHSEPDSHLSSSCAGSVFPSPLQAFLCSLGLCIFSSPAVCIKSSTVVVGSHGSHSPPSPALQVVMRDS